MNDGIKKIENTTQAKNQKTILTKYQLKKKREIEKK